MSLCQYSALFGKPGQGAHSLRIPLLNWALVDTLLTVLAAWLLARWTRSNFWLVLLTLFLVGTVAHVLFCVPTTVTQTLGLGR